MIPLIVWGFAMAYVITANFAQHFFHGLHSVTIAILLGLVEVTCHQQLQAQTLVWGFITVLVAAFLILLSPAQILLFPKSANDEETFRDVWEPQCGRKVKVE